MNHLIDQSAKPNMFNSQYQKVFKNIKDKIVRKIRRRVTIVNYEMPESVEYCILKLIIIMEMNLLIYSTKINVQALAIYSKTQILLCDENQIYLYDVTIAKPIANLNSKQKMYPISIYFIKTDIFCVQQRVGRCSIYQIANQNGYHINFLCQYQIGQIGFTKIGYLNTLYTEEGKIITTNEQLTFFCLNTQQYEIYQYQPKTGKVIQKHTYSQTQQIHLNFIKSFKYLNQNHLLVASEGYQLRHILLSKQVSINSLHLESTQQIKVILSIECLSDYRCAVALRQTFIAIVDWKKLQIVNKINVNPFCRTIILSKQSQIPNSILYLISKRQIISYNLQSNNYHLIATVIDKTIIQSKSKQLMIHDIDYKTNIIVGSTNHSKIFFIEM